MTLKTNITVLALSAALLSGTAISQAHADEVKWMSPDFYIGGQAGYSEFNSEAETTGEEFEGDSFDGGIIAGASYEWPSRFYLGLEGAYNFANADDTEDVGGTDVDIEREDSWSVTLRPGYRVNDPWLVYGIVGFSRTDFEGSVPGYEGDDADGLSLGAGAEYTINNNWGIRGEYIYTDYDDVQGFDDNVENAFRAGLLYRFN